MNKLTTLELSSLTLKQILEEDILFRIAIKSTIKKYGLSSKEDILKISTILGANLRHYYLLEKISKDEELELEEMDKYYFSIIISDALFSKKISKEEIGMLKDNKIPTKKYLELQEKYSTLDSINAVKEEVSDGKMSEFEYLSIRYNTPIWLVKMWNKHFQRFLRLILRNNIHESDTSLAVNTLKISTEEVLQMEGFKPSTFNDMVLYNGKAIRHLPIFKNHLIYPLKESERSILDEVEFKEDDRIIIFDDQRGDNFHLKIKELIKDTNWVKYCTSSHEDYGKTRTIVQEDVISLKKDRNNFVSYRVEQKDLHTCLIDEENNIDLFFIIPKSSNFDEIRHSPDYLLHFKMESLDELILGEKQLILQALTYVKEGGKVIYIVPTLNNKEGRNLIKEILNVREDATLIKEHQFFPFGDFHNSLYFAILEKKRKIEDD
ncbi:MAG: hypothetical protein IJQ67_07325 [Bacilli bacterium]|nr:hypothetical protein [Bacilli bacterium]